MTSKKRITRFRYGFIILAAIAVITTAACSGSAEPATGELDRTELPVLAKPSVAELYQGIEEGRRDYNPEDFECGKAWLEHDPPGTRHDHLRAQTYCILFGQGAVKWSPSRPPVIIDDPASDFWMIATLISGPDDGRIVLVDHNHCESTPESEVVGLDCPLVERLVRVCTSWHGYAGIDPLWPCLGRENIDELLNYSFVFADDPETVHTPMAGITAVDCGELRLFSQRFSGCGWTESEFILTRA